MSAPRLIAYVQPPTVGVCEEWSWIVEWQNEKGGCLFTTSSANAVLPAQLAAEFEARKHGFELDWRGGFVAHGVPVETTKRGAQDDAG